MTQRKNAAVGFIFITLLIDVTGIGLIIPVIPDLLKELAHVNTSEASAIGGWLIFAYAICQFLFAPMIGSLSDRYGRRPVLLASLFGFGLDYILLALAPTLFWLFIGRIIAGIFGASFTTGAAYIADVSPPEKRSQNFGLIGVAFGVGFILGPMLGGLLGEVGLRVPFFVAAGLSLVNWLYGFFILPESLPAENRRKFEWRRANPFGALKQIKKYPVILGLFGALAFVYIASHAVQGTWSFFTIEKFGFDKKMVGISLGVVGVLSAIVQGGLIRVIIPKLGPAKSLYYGLVLYTIGLILFAFAMNTTQLFIFLIPYCLGGIAGPAIQGIISNEVPPNEQGELQGAATSLMSLSAIIGPLLMTTIFSHFTRDPLSPDYFPGAPMLTGAVLTAISFFLTRATLVKNKVK